MTVSRRPIAIRADGGSDIGLGHVMRCAALARALLAAGQPVIWLTKTPDILPLDLVSDIEVVALAPAEDEASSLQRGLAQTGSHGLIADWPLTDIALCAGLRQAGIWLALIGNHTGAAAADFIIRQRFQAQSDESHVCDGSAVLLLGPGYARCPKRIVRPAPSRLLVSLGGSRTRTLDRVLDTLNDLPAAASMEIDIRRPVAGKQSLQEAGLRDAMLAADIGILAAGTSLHEAAATGLPSLAIPIAANQAQRAQEFESCGLGIRVDPAEDRFEENLRAALARLAGSDTLRRDCAEAGQSRVDGLGASRVAARVIARQNSAGTAQASGASGRSAGNAG
tara:strand:+ start:34235 stop:35245 length:1011 start_codon:yes stop_codon:yes gene_type:complete